MSVPPAEIVGVAFLAACSLWRQRSLSTRLEYCLLTALLFCNWPWEDCTYLSFVLVKSVVSLMWFWFRLCTNQGAVRGEFVYYCMGFSTGFFHAGVIRGNSVFHYVNRRENRENRHDTQEDNICGLEPVRTPLERVTVKIIQPCGFVCGETLTNEVVLRRLQSSGKCHNWAINAAYYMSLDKYVASLSVMFLRWDLWLCCIIALLVRGCDTGGTVDYAAFLRIGLIALAIIDVLNLDDDQWRHHNHARNEMPFAKLLDVCKSLSLAVGFVLYCLFVRSALGSWGEIAALGCLVVVSCLMLRCLACMRRPHRNAP